MADLAWHKGFQFFTDAGVPLAGGTINVYDATTTNARTVYKDSGAATPWTQPITLDSAGRLTDPVYIPTGSWKYILKTSGGSTVVTEDNIPGAVTIPSATFAQPETPVLTKAVSYGITTSDLGKLIKGDPTGGDIVFTLPSAVSAGDGATLWVQHTGTAGKITVVPTGVQTIDGGASVILLRPRSWFRLTSDGANWSAEGADRPSVPLAKTADYTVGVADYSRTITVDATAGPVTLSLPSAASAGSGFFVTVKRIDATTNAVTIDANGAETIDGALTLILSTQYEAAKLRCNGTAWYEETSRAAHFGSLTEDTAPDLSADFLITQDVSGFATKKAKLLRLFAPIEPQGRLTLTTATPVLSSDVTTAGTIFYTPYKGLFFPLYDGVGTVLASIGAELSLVLDSNSGHTGYQQSGKNFDLFLVNDVGTIRLVSGPAWSSDTARATALEYKNGFRCNAASMTAKFDTSASTLTIAQDRGILVGTVRMSADGVTKWVANPAAAAGGGNCQLLLRNAYNRLPAVAISRDSTDTWTYATATWRAANGNNSNRVTAVFDDNDEVVRATYAAIAKNSGGAEIGSVGIGLDSTSAFTGLTGVAGVGSFVTAISTYVGLPGSGLHFFQGVEFASGSTVTFAGDNALATSYQSGVVLEARM